MLSAVWWNISLALRNTYCEMRTLFKLVNEAESTFRPLTCQLVSVLLDNLGHNELVVSTRFACYFPLSLFFFFQISLTTCLSVWLLFLSLLESRDHLYNQIWIHQEEDTLFFCISASVSRRARPPESVTAYFKLPGKANKTNPRMKSWFTQMSGLLYSCYLFQEAASSPAVSINHSYDTSVRLFFPPPCFFVRESMMKPRNNTRT